MLTRDPVVTLCVAMLGAAACWLGLVLACVAGELWQARRHGRRACVRRVVLVCCGLAIAAPAPAALADDHGISGLPMPDRATGPAQHRTHQTVVVDSGDCLWHLAAEGLPAEATNRQVAARSRAIYRLNRTLIGADPDLIQPGQRLILPR